MLRADQGCSAVLGNYGPLLLTRSCHKPIWAQQLPRAQRFLNRAICIPTDVSITDIEILEACVVRQLRGQVDSDMPLQ